MLYFSELSGKKVSTEDGILIGNLEDLIFLASENPIVNKIVIRQLNNQKLIISTEYLQKINSHITIDKEFLATYLEENELYLVKNLLDKQIIDIKGYKVVRVNDVVIQDKNVLRISGVDIGFFGILRRIRIAGDIPYKIASFLKWKFSSSFLSWADIQPLELIRGQVKLKKKEEKLEKIRPEDLADYLERTNVVNARKFLKMLGTEQAAEVISNLNINYQTALFRHFRPEKAARFLHFIDPDDAVDVILTLSKKKQEDIIALLDEKTKAPILNLLTLSKNHIGSLITTEFLSVDSESNVREVVEKIRKETVNFGTLDYIYVINKKHELVGVFNLHSLILQDASTPVYKFMVQNVVVAHLTTPELIVMKRLMKYALYALPIIDEYKHIIGIITTDDIAHIYLKKL